LYPHKDANNEQPVRGHRESHGNWNRRTCQIGQVVSCFQLKEPRNGEPQLLSAPADGRPVIRRRLPQARGGGVTGYRTRMCVFEKTIAAMRIRVARLLFFSAKSPRQAYCRTARVKRSAIEGFYDRRSGKGSCFASPRSW